MKPSIGRIVLFQNWRRLEAAAIVIGVLPSGAVNLKVFHADGSDAIETNVPGWQASEEAIEQSRQNWAAWDDYCDEVRARGQTIEGSSPQTPQSSWRWPPRVDEAAKTPAPAPATGIFVDGRGLSGDGPGAAAGSDVLGLAAALKPAGEDTGDAPAADNPDSQFDRPDGSAA